MLLILIGLAIAIVLFFATGGHLIFRPLFFVLPLGFFGRRRGNRRHRY